MRLAPTLARADSQPWDALGRVDVEPLVGYRKRFWGGFGGVIAGGRDVRRNTMEDERVLPRRTPWGSILARGVIAGVVAGALFTVAEPIGATVMGMVWEIPWRMFASIVGGASAIQDWGIGSAFAVGLAVHAVVSAAWGGLYAAAIGWRLAANAAWQAIAGAAAGFVIWVIDFYVLAPLFWPWFVSANSLCQAVMHVVFYGVPLGLTLAAQWSSARAAGMQRQMA